MGTVVQPAGWPRPRGYAHGMSAQGRILAIGGQIGVHPAERELSRGLLSQFAQCLDNVIEVVQAAGGQASDVISLTIFVTDQRQYHAASKEIGKAWRDRFGKHYPAMALVQVGALMEPRAVIEIQGLAVISS